MEEDAALKSPEKKPMLEVNNYFLLQLPEIDDKESEMNQIFCMFTDPNANT